MEVRQVMRASIKLIFSVSLLGAFGWGLYHLASDFARFAISLGQPLIVAAILAASATIVAATITVVAGKIFERKKEAEAHFRGQKYDQYSELLKIIFELISQSGQAAESGGHAIEVSGNVAKQLAAWQCGV
jgi:hypothetical protein